MPVVEHGVIENGEQARAATRAQRTASPLTSESSPHERQSEWQLAEHELVSHPEHAVTGPSQGVVAPLVGAGSPCVIAAIVCAVRTDAEDPREVSNTLGGGSSLTTWERRLASLLGLPARNGLRTAGAVGGKASAVVGSFAGGYWIGSGAACVGECSQ